MTHAYLHIAETGARIASDVRLAVRLAGGRITSTPERARLHVACARSCRDARLPKAGKIRLLVAEGEEEERRVARATGFDDVMDPVLAKMVEPLRKWLELADLPNVKFHVSNEGMVIGDVRISLWPQELSLVRTLREANGAHCSRGELLEKVWNVKADTRTQRVGSTVHNVNRKTRPFGVEIEGSRQGWRLRSSS